MEGCHQVTPVIIIFIIRSNLYPQRSRLHAHRPRTVPGYGQESIGKADVIPPLTGRAIPPTRTGSGLCRQHLITVGITGRATAAREYPYTIGRTKPGPPDPMGGGVGGR